MKRGEEGEIEKMGEREHNRVPLYSRSVSCCATVIIWYVRNEVGFFSFPRERDECERPRCPADVHCNRSHVVAIYLDTRYI